MSLSTLPRQRRRGPALAASLALIAAGLTVAAVSSAGPASAATARQVENLDRGVISVRSGSGNLVSWRLLGTDPSSVAFNVYRSGSKLNSSPITNSTNYYDSGASSSASYTVRAVINGVEQGESRSSLSFGNGYLDVPISKPNGGTTPDGVGYYYTANDASVGDVDGDGVYEIILKWDPSNAKDNSQSGYTGNVYIDAYRLNGTRLWRIDLGRNIRAGAHYTQFQVYDYDGDGKAEVAMKTADGTRDGAGTVIGNGNADYRNSGGYVLSGPEYLTVFNGQTGRAMATVDYVPSRGTVSNWGDNYGNRVDRFLAGTAYLDGQRPSMIFARGYYTRSVIVAWDWRNGQLSRRWTFDSNSSTNGSAWTGQGNHSLTIGDVDQDGRDEVVYGSMAIDDNGWGLWTNGLGHGDAGHLGDLDPNRNGLEYFKVDEDSSKPGSYFANARNGQPYWTTASGGDNGRGVAADIYAGSPGAESWSARDTTLRSTNGSSVGREPSSINFLSWWDGDPLRELLDQTKIDKYGTSGETRLLTGSDVHSNNGTKATPSLSGDILGDWREEVIWPTSSDNALRIYSTPIQTSLRFPTLVHDTMYRVALAWQNTAYNQPPHPSFFLGNGVTSLPQPEVYVPGGVPPITTSTSSRPPTTTTTTSTTTSNGGGSGDGRLVTPGGKCLDVAGSSNGSAAVINDCNGGSGQSWTFQSDGTLRTLGGSMCLDANARGTANGTTLIIWSCHGEANQRFSQGSNDSIVNAGSGRCVDVPNGSTNNGTQVQLYDCWGGDPQRWTYNSGGGNPTTTTTTRPTTTTCQPMAPGVVNATPDSITYSLPSAPCTNSSTVTITVYRSQNDAQAGTNPAGSVIVAKGATSATITGLQHNTDYWSKVDWYSQLLGPTRTPAIVATTTTTTSTTTTTTTTSSTSSTTSTSGGSGGSCSASYAVVGSWPGGFQGDVKVTAGNQPISSWTVTWTFPDGQTINTVWGATVTQSGSSVTAKNVDYNGTLGAGASTSFGFIGSANGSNGVPTVTCS